MAFFIFKQLTGYKKKLLNLCSVLNNKINMLICNAKVKGLRNYFSFTREDLNLNMLVKTIRKYPVHLATALALVTGIALAGYAVAGAGSPAEKKQVATSEMSNGKVENSTAERNSLIFNRGVSPSDINRSRSYQAGSHISRGWINRNDMHLLAMVIEGEAADEPVTGKVAVGAVILNRTESGDFPRNVRNVVYQPWAFESVMNGQYTRPLSNDSIRAANMAVNGWDPSGGALYFWNPVTAKSKWVWQKPITLQIGKHVFAK